MEITHRFPSRIEPYKAKRKKYNPYQNSSAIGMIKGNKNNPRQQKKYYCAKRNNKLSSHRGNHSNKSAILLLTAKGNANIPTITEMLAFMER